MTPVPARAAVIVRCANEACKRRDLLRWGEVPLDEVPKVARFIGRAACADCGGPLAFEVGAFEDDPEDDVTAACVACGKPALRCAIVVPDYARCCEKCAHHLRSRAHCSFCGGPTGGARCSHCDPSMRGAP